MQIEPYNANQLNTLINLSLRAWTPVFDLLQKSLYPHVYQAFYPESWQVSQQKAVEECINTVKNDD